MEIEVATKDGGKRMLSLNDMTEGDASKVLLPHPDLLTGGTDHARAIDRALRAGRDKDAFAIADAWIGSALGWKEREMAALRRAHAVLRDARLS